MATDAAAPSGWNLITRGPFARLFWSGFITSVGDWAALFAQITLADAIAGATGILVVLAARLLPGLLGGAIGGILADRASRKVPIVLADIGRGVLVLSLAWVTRLDFLFVVSFLLELLTLLGQPARTAALPTLVPERSLLTANSLTLGAAYGTFPIGAAISWMLGLFPNVELFGVLPATTEAKVFAFDAVTFFASAVLISTIPLAVAALTADRQRRSRFDLRTPLRDFVDGIKFVGSDRTVRPIVLGMSVALFGGGILLVLGRGFVADVLQADEAGFFALLTALGTGAGAGIVGLSVYSDRLVRRDLAYAFTVTLSGVALVALSLVKTVAGGMGWAIVMGLGAGSAYVTGFTHLHEAVADELRGRTFAALFSLMRIGLLVSMAVTAPMADGLEGRFAPPFDNATRDIMFVGGSIVLVTGAATLFGLRHHIKEQYVPGGLRSLRTAGRAFSALRGRGRRPVADENPLTGRHRDRDGEAR